MVVSQKSTSDLTMPNQKNQLDLIDKFHIFLELLRVTVTFKLLSWWAAEHRCWEPERRRIRGLLRALGAVLRNLWVLRSHRGKEEREVSASEPSLVKSMTNHENKSSRDCADIKLQQLLIHNYCQSRNNVHTFPYSHLNPLPTVHERTQAHSPLTHSGECLGTFNFWYKLVSIFMFIPWDFQSLNQKFLRTSLGGIDENWCDVPTIINLVKAIFVYPFFKGYFNTTCWIGGGVAMTILDNKISSDFI